MPCLYILYYTYTSRVASITDLLCVALVDATQVIGLSAPGAANIDYVYMRDAEGVVPGTEGLASAAAILSKMGIKIIRQGGE